MQRSGIQACILTRVMISYHYLQEMEVCIRAKGFDLVA